MSNSVSTKSVDGISVMASAILNEKSNIFDNEVFFFDFDGVIIDSMAIKGKAFGELYKAYGKQTVKKVITHHFLHGGMNRKDKIRYYHENFLGKKISEKEVEKISRRFSRIIFNKILKANFIGGALEFLKLLKKKNKKCFVVSAVPQDEIREIVNKKKLTRFFLGVLGHPKSKEEILKYFIKKYGIDKKNAIYFGDAANDFEASKKNGIKFIGINYFDSQRCYRDFRELLLPIKSRT